MQVTRILAAAILSVAAAGAMAQEIDRAPSAPFVSQRTRAAVEAEAQNARAAGPSHWASGGELNAATPAVIVVDSQVATRQQVKAELALARASHQLPRVGEI